MSITGSNLTISDRDSPKLSSATIKLLNRPDGNSEELSVNLNGTQIRILDNSSGTLRLGGPDTIANFEKVLRTASYRNKASSPNLATRSISFVINDGEASSAARISTVKIINPKISLSMTPETQTIAKGDSAVFRIDIKNVGSVRLVDVRISSSDAPNCDTSFSSISPGETRTKSCGVSDVQTEFTHAAMVTAKDDFGNKVSAQDSSRVEVINPNIRIVKSPSSQTVEKGGTAIFEIFVVNTNSLVDLYDVKVVDELTPDCNREVGSLRRQEQFSYSCKQEDVESAFVNEIIVSGTDRISNELVQDGSIAAVEVIATEIELSADPDFLISGGGNVIFEVQVANRGSRPIRLQEMSVSELGAITNPNNNLLQDNSCLDALLTEIDVKKSYICTFTANVGPTYGIREYVLHAVSKDADNNQLVDTGEAVVIVADSSRLSVALDASTTSIAAPGGVITETVSVSPITPAGVSGSGVASSFELEALRHSVLGNLNGIGSCSLPQAVGAGETYSCIFQVAASGQIGGSDLHIVAAAGTDAEGITPGNTDYIEITYFDPRRQSRWLPLVAGITLPVDDNNDTACAASRLQFDAVQSFFLDDENDWYVFSVKHKGNISIQIDNLTSPDAQVLVYAALDCDNLSGRDLVAHNGDYEPNKLLSFEAEAGEHYLWITNPNGITQQSPYTILLQSP